MNDKYNSYLVENSKILRKEMTQEERHLWYDFLKKLPVTVHRQKIFEHYIVDFYIAKYKIVIELDGYQHGEEKQIKKDEKRDFYFKEKGFKILRYTNKEIHEKFEGVCKDITNHLKEKPSP